MKIALTTLSLATALVAGCRVDPVRNPGDGGPWRPVGPPRPATARITDGRPADAATSDAPDSMCPPARRTWSRRSHRWATCLAAASCSSGLCVDGVCCDSACSGSCEACDRPDHQGTCSPITGAPRGGRAPCTGQGTTCAGSCDGMDGSRCVYPGSEQECAAGKCTAGVATTRSVCNGAGVCLPGAEVSCAPFSCDGAICAGGCGVGSPCAAGSFCDGGRCFPVKLSGAACRMPAECASAACVDGRCCTRASCGTCEACTGAGGTCTKLSGVEDPGTCSGDRICTPGGSCRKKAGGTCGGTDECATPGCVSGRCCTVATCGGCGACTGPGGTCVMNTTGSRWEQAGRSANDIDVGPDGSVWVIGSTAMPGGFGIHRWTGSSWETVPGGATRIGVGPAACPGW
jgi:hypothetical protein